MALGFSFALGACAVTEPPAIVSTTGAFAQGSEIQLAPFEEEPSLRGAFGRALTEAFRENGARISGDGQLIADFALAERDALSGAADPAASTSENVDWTSQPRDRALLDRCDARRVRATLVILDRASGEVTYRGVAEATDCAIDDVHIAALARALVADARTD